MPSFKAGFHYGKVNAGEIGEVKKDMMFTGDVLNTTARLQGLCKNYDVDILVTEDLIKRAQPGNSFEVRNLGE